MGETNWKNWIILFVVATGLTFEVMKRTSLKPDNSLEAAAAAGVTEPYSVGTERARHKRHQVEPQSAKSADKANRELLEKFIAANAPGTTGFDATTAAAAAKKKKEECDEKNPKIDPLTGKPIACKKKKEKKEEAKAEPPPAPPAKTPEKPSNDNFYPQTAGGQVVPQQQNQKPDDSFTSLEEWQRRLLNSPDVNETKRFIEKYRQNLVTAEVFYKITQMMLDDSRESMKQLGVMCAGLTPSSTSFDMLATLIKGESSGSAARRDAETYVARYADLSNVRFLESLMRAPSANAFTIVLATQKVGDSAKHYLNLPTSTTATNATTGAPATTSAATTAQITAVKNNATYFTRFLGILQDLSRNADANVKNQAANTLSSLQTLITGVQQQSTGTTTAPVASTN